MTSDRFARVKELLLAVADLGEAERAAFLGEACKDDPDLRREVEAILEHQNDATGIVRTDGAASSARLDSHPDTIGRYKILEAIGEGGMGIVYLAEQEHPIRRRVALKIIKLGMDTREVIGRFESERQALAIMDHPHVAKVFDAGATDDGRPYFVMEHVSGVPITDYCNRHRLSTRERMELFVSVCWAIHHAHQKGIIHRDVKPSNILVGTKDGRPSPKIIDFGVAKAIDQRLTEKTVYTEQGRLIGTPEYMSPEQAEMTGLDIDITTDVYSLGVVLYELLVGALPFEAHVLREAGFEGIRRIIREVDPPRPSTRISTLGVDATAVALHRKTEPATLVKLVRGEPDWIIMRAMEKDRTRRYQSASAFAADIERYLQNEPIIASPPSTVYRFRKLVKRHKGVFASLGAVFLALAIGIVISTAMYFWAETARRRAEGEARKAKAINEFVSQALVSSDPHQGGAQGFLVTEAMEQAIELLDAGELDDQPETEAALRLTISEILNGNARSEQALQLAERALQINQELYPGDHQAVANSLNIVANCLTSLGRSADALPKCEAALEMFQRLFEGDHPDVATSLSVVTYCLHSLGRSAEALPKCEAALEMYQRLFEGDHPQVATGLNNVASCLQSLGRSADALPQFETALAMRQRLFEGDHARVAISLNNVARCLKSLGRSAEALPKYEAALAMRQRLFQGDHPGVATSLNNVAKCLQSLDRSEDALPKLEAALEMYQRVFEGDHPRVAQSLNNVARCLKSLGRSAEALPKYEVALAMRQWLYEGDHPDVATSLNNVASCLKSLGRSAEALPKYEAALAMLRRVLPPGHPSTLYPQIGLARTLVTLGRYTDAESLLRDAAEQCERSEPSRRKHWQSLVEESVHLYDAWNVAEPDKGYDAKAAEWRAKIEDYGASTCPFHENPSLLTQLRLRRCRPNRLARGPRKDGRPLPRNRHNGC